MKTNTPFNIVTAVLLMIAVVTLNQFKTGSDHLADELRLFEFPASMSLQIGQQELITQIVPHKSSLDNDLDHKFNDLMKSSVANFKKRISQFYTGDNSNYYITLYTDTNNEAYFVLLKENRIVTTMKVISLSETNLKLSFGEIRFLSESEALRALTQKSIQTENGKLAQTSDFEQAL